VAQLWIVRRRAIMNIFRNPRVCLWIGRILPAAVWVLWLVAMLMPNLFGGHSLGANIFFLFWILSLVAYILWAYFVLPVLLFADSYKGIFPRVGYFLFTGVTAGLGPTIWYFLRVDPVLRKMADARKGE
jgi:hypothetical protein